MLWEKIQEVASKKAQKQEGLEKGSGGGHPEITRLTEGVALGDWDSLRAKLTGKARKS